MQFACNDWTKSKTEMNDAQKLLFWSAIIKVKFHVNVCFSPQQIVDSFENGVYGDVGAPNKWVVDMALQPDRTLQVKNLQTKDDVGALVFCAVEGNNSPNVKIVKTPEKIEPFRKMLKENKISIEPIPVSEALKEVEALHAKLYKEATGSDFVK